MAFPETQNGLALQRCFNHAEREAVARCPECGRFFCRECITEHDDRVVCAACLTQLTAAGKPRKRAFAALGRAMLCLAALFLLWTLFYGMGRGLSLLPSSFHEGALWQVSPWEP